MNDGPLGIVGGTFDPVHFGHLRLAEEALDLLDLESVLWLPSGNPPQRQAVAAAAQRLAMLRLAVTGQPRFEIDEAEISATSPSYTVPALERLRRRVGARRPLVLVLGADAFAGLASWHRWRDLFGLAHIAVATRPGAAVAEADPALAEELGRRRAESPAALRQHPAGAIVGFAMTPLAISATALRDRLGAGGSARYLLPDTVLDYIQRHRLYTA